MFKIGFALKSFPIIYRALQSLTKTRIVTKIISLINYLLDK